MKLTLHGKSRPKPSFKGKFTPGVLPKSLPLSKYERTPGQVIKNELDTSMNDNETLIPTKFPILPQPPTVVGHTNGVHQNSHSPTSANNMLNTHSQSKEVTIVLVMNCLESQLFFQQSELQNPRHHNI